MIEKIEFDLKTGKLSAASMSVEDFIAITQKYNAKKDVATITHDAIVAARPTRRTHKQFTWTKDEVTHIAGRITSLYRSQAERPHLIVAKEIMRSGANKRKPLTVQAMTYHLYRFLKDGQLTGLSQKNIVDLTESGFGAGSLSNVVTTNMLGSTRTLEVHQA